MKPSVACTSLFLTRPYLPSYGSEDTERNMGQIEISIWKAWWLESLPSLKWTHVSPTFQFWDSDWFLYKVQEYCFTLKAMQSGGGWSAHPCHPLQTQGVLFSFCFYIPCGESHNAWIEDAYTQCLHWVPNKLTWQACPDGDHQILPWSSPLWFGAQISEG